LATLNPTSHTNEVSEGTQLRGSENEKELLPINQIKPMAVLNPGLALTFVVDEYAQAMPVCHFSTQEYLLRWFMLLLLTASTASGAD
jgi:hypothetical protein